MQKKKWRVLKTALDPGFTLPYSPAHTASEQHKLIIKFKPCGKGRFIPGGLQPHESIPQRLALARKPPAATIHSLICEHDTLAGPPRTQAKLRPIAPGKVSASFAPLGRRLFWELFLRPWRKTLALCKPVDGITIRLPFLTLLHSCYVMS
jgi:hypothetical protein